MNNRWEQVVKVAREMSATLARGRRPDDYSVELLVRGVLEFQASLVGGEDRARARLRDPLR